ncbi:hypothetical protein EHQ81_01520 [Leptospira selangorensis]|uniref:Lipoprotein n=1 Tax=Leptospira selangorensis TaxID=2484982 RepID=A0A5F2BVU2_9LEPT|nr:hypothetical protein [Leptospira selangorensis]TGM12040.1 hypothetical protein EHQ82_21095 [Leptospira selangorensis]TGM15099.1 hypothetical protein EHQ81_01520 [Leptospira selangorensis]
MKVLLLVCQIFWIIGCATEELKLPNVEKNSKQDNGTLRIDFENRSKDEFDEISIHTLCFSLKQKIESRLDCDKSIWKLNSKKINKKDVFEVELPAGEYFGFLSTLGSQYIESFKLSGSFKKLIKNTTNSKSCEVNFGWFDEFECNLLRITANKTTEIKIVITDFHESLWVPSILIGFVTLGIVIIPPSVRHAEIQVNYPTSK